MTDNAFILIKEQRDFLCPMDRRTVGLPYGNNLAPVEADAIHLSDEDGSNSLIKCCAIHIDCSSHREDKACHSLVNAQVFL